MFAKQVPLARALPMWGGISADGFREVTWHATKKISVEEWVRAVEAGKLTKALKALNPGRGRGSWSVLCDNEGFLRATASTAAHRDARVSLWQIPPKSPDLNPIEQFWSWLRRRLRAVELQDLAARRPALSKAAYQQRVRRICRSAAAQRAASAIAQNFRRTCQEVVRKRGAAARG